MVDLDYVDVGSKIAITTTTGEELETQVEFYKQMHRCDKGYGVLLTARSSRCQESIEVGIDQKAARLIVAYLQTQFDI